MSTFHPSDLDKELKAFEREERQRLGLPPADDAATTRHWSDPVPRHFVASQRAHTTILLGGLTAAHDMFIQASLNGLGYNVKALDVPDTDALQYGREYGNRGQCNPTYFTVGNLVKSLVDLEKSGKSREEIIKNYLFVTAGACGPCRFGTYVTEYRKALRDSGFDGFRVLLFQQQGGLKQATGEDAGIQMNPRFFWKLIRAAVAGDVMNALMYRIRPYEVEPGSTDKALAQARGELVDAFENGKSVVRAFYRARKIMAAVKVDRLKPKPKVGIIGEFWAMTTEGDGNYKMQKFLEGEGAEVDVQLITAWQLYMTWQVRFDTENRAKLHGADKKSDSKFGLEGVDVRKRLLMIWAAEKFLHGLFQVTAKALGLYDYHLPDMEEMAEVSHQFYDNNLRGGEGHMEVGKLIQNVARSKVNMTLSVKPFGCMPSSSVSDGVQSFITELYPQAIFLPIETTGDGAVNVYSRVQMQLFKARQQAAAEVERALADTGQTIEGVRDFVARHPRLSHAFHKSPHRAGCTAADLVYDVAARRNPVRYWLARAASVILRHEQLADHEAHEKLLAVARTAADKAKSAKRAKTMKPTAPAPTPSVEPVARA